jgi:FMN phosphatase YigB (HAD superfamily)
MLIASFDVFDTVITRVIGDPKSVFLLLGKTLLKESLITCMPETFARARIQAESLAFKNIGIKHQLQHVYSELAIALHLSEEQHRTIMQLELELESKFFRPIPIARKTIKAARDRGDRIAFISDMYLPSAFIKEQLISHSFWQEGDILYVSNEYGKSKATGQLFQELIEQEGILPDRILHWGNDLRVDVKGARKVGLKAKHFVEGNLNRYEQILESHSYATEGLSSAMAGASRLVRLQLPAISPSQEALRDVAAGVVAPTLVGYVLWILQQARKMGLKRLYFVSRDGQIILEIARKLIGKLDIDCELRYIYGSRLSWNLPALASLDTAQACKMLKKSSWLLDTTSPLSIRNFWERIDIVPEEIEKSLSSVGFQKEDWDKTLSSKEQQLLHLLLDDSQIYSLILEKAAQQHKILINYFNQEKLLDAMPKGIVDLGWFGSSYDAIYPILKSKNVPLDVGLFFGLRSRSPMDRNYAKKGYFFDEEFQTGFASALPGLGIVPLEMFCAADHSTVVGFVENNGLACPSFREKDNQKIIDWGLTLVRDAVYSFTENLLLDKSFVNPYADVREASAQVLSSFWLTPTASEAIAWGNFPWEKGHSERTDALAESYHWGHVFKSFLTLRLASHQSIWTEGAVTRSSTLVRNAMQGFLHFRRLLIAIKLRIFNQ